MNPRHPAAVREHATVAEETDSKRARTENHKKQRVETLSAEHEQMIGTIKFGAEEYYTLDSYETEPVNDQADEGPDGDVWANEEELHFAGIDERLWSDHDLKHYQEKMWTSLQMRSKSKDFFRWKFWSSLRTTMEQSMDASLRSL